MVYARIFIFYEHVPEDGVERVEAGQLVEVDGLARRGVRLHVRHQALGAAVELEIKGKKREKETGGFNSAESGTMDASEGKYTLSPV